MTPFYEEKQHDFKFIEPWQTESWQTVPVGVDELICDLGPYAASVDHCAGATGEAGNYWYLLYVVF